MKSCAGEGRRAAAEWLMGPMYFYKPKIKAKYAHGNLVCDLEADSIAGIFEQMEEIQRQAKERHGVICDLCACLL